MTGDPAQLRQLLQNLVANAVKFRAEEPPRVEVSAQRRRRGSRRGVSVADNGIGIAAEHAERIFEMFQRLHAAERLPGHRASGWRYRQEDRRTPRRVESGAEPREEGGTVFRFDAAGMIDGRRHRTSCSSRTTPPTSA